MGKHGGKPESPKSEPETDKTLSTKDALDQMATPTRPTTAPDAEAAKTYAEKAAEDFDKSYDEHHHG